MLEQITQQEYITIDKEAKIKKDTVDFICNYINSNYEKLESTFRQKRNKTNKEEKLYRLTKNMLDEVEKEATKFIGVVVCYEKPSLTPDMKLGLIEWSKKRGFKAYSPKVTSKGKEIVNEYRKIKGLKSLEKNSEENSKVIERFTKN